MADTTTENYGWTMPTVGADNNTWGGLLNDNLSSQDSIIKAVSDVADAAIPKASGTFTGTLTGPNAHLTSDLTVDDDVTVGGDLALTGNLTVGGDEHLTGDLTVDGAVAFGDLTLTGTLAVGGISRLAGLQLGNAAATGADATVDVDTDAYLAWNNTGGSFVTQTINFTNLGSGFQMFFVCFQNAHTGTLRYSINGGGPVIISPALNPAAGDVVVFLFTAATFHGFLRTV
jgi:hypothetical protein